MNETGSRLSKRRAIAEACCLLYIYYLLLTIFIILPPVSFAAAGMQLSLRPGTAVTLAGVVFAESLALGMAIAYFRRRQVSLRDAGLMRPTHPSVIVAAVVGALAYSAWTAQLPDVGENLSEVSLFKLWGAVAGVFGAFVEELIFRGYLLRRFDQAGISKASQILLTGIFFGLLHLGFGRWGVLCTSLLGMFLGGLFVFGNRSLTGPLACHCLINAIIEPWLLLWLLTYYAQQYGSGGPA